MDRWLLSLSIEILIDICLACWHTLAKHVYSPTFEDPIKSDSFDSGPYRVPVQCGSIPLPFIGTQHNCAPVHSRIATHERNQATETTIEVVKLDQTTIDSRVLAERCGEHLARGSTFN